MGIDLDPPLSSGASPELRAIYREAVALRRTMLALTADVQLRHADHLLRQAIGLVLGGLRAMVEAAPDPAEAARVRRLLDDGSCELLRSYLPVLCELLDDAPPDGLATFVQAPAGAVPPCSPDILPLS